MVTLASTAAFISIRDYYNRALHTVYGNGFKDVVVDYASSNEGLIAVIGFSNSITVYEITIMANGSVVGEIKNTLHYEDSYIYVDFLNATVSDSGVVCSRNSILVIVLKGTGLSVVLNTSKGDYYIG